MKRLAVPWGNKSNHVWRSESKLLKSDFRMLFACKSPNVNQNARNAVLTPHTPTPMRTKTRHHHDTSVKVSCPFLSPVPNFATMSNIFPRTIARLLLSAAEQQEVKTAVTSTGACEGFVKAKRCFHVGLEGRSTQRLCKKASCVKLLVSSLGSLGGDEAS